MNIERLKMVLSNLIQIVNSFIQYSEVALENIVTCNKV